VAPACRIGSTGTPGQNSAASFSIGRITSGVSGGGGEVGPRVFERGDFDRRVCHQLFEFRTHGLHADPREDTAVDVGPCALRSALVAWPASSMVATQVVRSVGIPARVLLETSASARSSAGSRKKAFMAFAISVSPLAAWIFAMPVKYARLRR